MCILKSKVCVINNPALVIHEVVLLPLTVNICRINGRLLLMV